MMENNMEFTYHKETYKIPSYNFDYMMDKIEKLNKRAKKMGLDPVVAEKVGESFITRSIDQYGKLLIKPITIKMVEVKVIGKSLKYDGWTFIGTIEHEKASKNLIKSVPGVELDHKYRDAPPDCHHCKTNRWRKKTFVCKHDDGREIQLGSTCIKDFLGHESPEAIAYCCEMLGKVGSIFLECEDLEFGNGARGEFWMPMKDFLKLTSAVIREHGWIPRSKDYLGEPTVDIVSYNVFPPAKVDRSKMVEVTKEDSKLAYRALEWAKSLHQDSAGNFSDYEYNLNTLANSAYLKPTEFGLAASMVGVFISKDEKRKLAKEKDKNFKNEFFGEIKKRYELVLKVISTKKWEDHYGWTTLYKMVDPDGRRFCWFSKSYKVNLDDGKTYKTKATIKAHNEWKDIKETVVTRLALA